MANDKNDNKDNNTRDHADFQDFYRRSSNFPNINEDEAEDLKLKGEGDVGLKNQDTNSETDAERIKDAMDQIDTEEEE